MKRNLLRGIGIGLVIGVMVSYTAFKTGNYDSSASTTESSEATGAEKGSEEATKKIEEEKKASEEAAKKAAEEQKASEEAAKKAAEEQKASEEAAKKAA